MLVGAHVSPAGGLYRAVERGSDLGKQTRHKLAVEEWNGQPVTTTAGRELLEAAGFVRDYQGMTLYAAWR